MRCERLLLTDEPASVAAAVRALVPGPASVADVVAEIIGRVREQGDEAVLEYTQRLDTGGPEPAALRVPDADLESAAEQLEKPLREGLERAIANVRRVAEAGLGSDRPVDFDGHEIVLREAPVERAAIYVPGGRAPYPSTVVMGVVTARVAGVEEVTVCSPPGMSGELDPVVLGACALAEASSVYRMGGAQAIAALAYGTQSVTPVDVLVGPGNLYVQEAKRQVSGHVGVDGFAGPSDLLVVADPDVDSELVVLDLLAQAEHGDGTVVACVSTSSELLERLERRVRAAEETGAVASLIEARDVEHAFEFAQAFAPEHLELMGPAAERLASRATRAGCVFVGPASATAFGDYVAGSNHILPTGGAARFASALSPGHFMRRFIEVRIGAGAGELARIAAPIARAEGFELHARSMEARIRDNGQP